MFNREEKESNDWKGVKAKLINSKTFMFASFVTLCTALVQTYQSTSKSGDEVRQKFDGIIDGLKNNTALYSDEFKNRLESMAIELAKGTAGGATKAQEILNSVISHINEQITNNPQLVKDAEDLKKFTTDTTSNFNTLRAVTLGGLATIIGSALLVDFLQQFKIALNPSDRTQLAVNGTLAVGMVTLLILRAKTCFSNEYTKAPAGYMCSQAADPTARGFNNFLIEIGFLGGADILLRFMNSCFKEGLRATSNAIGSSVWSFPGSVASSAKTQYALWLKPGQQAVISEEGVDDVVVSVNNDSKQPLLPSPTAPTTRH